MEHGPFLEPFAGSIGAWLALWVMVMLFALTVFVLGMLVTMEAYRVGRQGWWVYLIAVFVVPLNLVAVVAWYAYLDRNPVLDSRGRPFL